MSAVLLYLPSAGAIPGVSGTFGAGVYSVDFTARSATYVSALPPGQQLYPVTRAGATYYVAASNASTQSKASADYLCSGTNDDRVIAAAIAALPTSGGQIVLSEGTFSVSASITLKAHVFITGMGKTATTVQLANGANTDIFSAQTNLINLAASGGSSPQGTLYDFGLANLTLDGNKANQASGPSYPLRFYGYSYILQNIEVKNGYSGNILSDWNAGNSFPPADSMMALWINVKEHDSGGIGVEFGGPHDSLFANCEFFQDLSHNLHLAPNANGCCFSNGHFWGPGVNTPNTASFLQTVYGQDTFVRANQSGLGTASDGLAWNQSPGSGTVTAAISSNTATFTGNGSEADGIFTHGSSTVSGGIDTRMDVVVGGDANNAVGLYWYGDGTSNNGYRCIYNGQLVLQKYVSGARTTIANPSVSISSATTTKVTIRVQHSGTTIKAKVWQQGTFEPTAWAITTTDSSFSSGKFGMWIWINSGTGVVYNYAAGSLRTQSGKVAMLVESTGVNCSNCIAESSDTAQVVVLAPNFVWTGGSVYDVLNGGYGFPSVSSGFQVGQQNTDPTYSGQITSAGGNGAYYCRFADVLIVDCQGANGAIWLDSDLGYNIFDITINQDLTGTDYTGALHSHSVFKRSGLTAANTSVLLLDSGVQLNKSSTIYSGNGAPSSGLGSSGDYYVRTDTPNASYQQLYINVSGSWVAFAGAPVQSSSAASIASSGTISTSGVSEARVTTSGAVTGVILQAGTVAGQEVSVVNESGNTITFAVAATSNVADGVSAVIAANRKMDFTWNSSQSKWYHS